MAVKTMIFPAAMSGRERREKMAIMETAISSTLSHPNVVQTYTYAVSGARTMVYQWCGSGVSVVYHCNASACWPFSCCECRARQAPVRPAVRQEGSGCSWGLCLDMDIHLYQYHQC